MPGTRYVHNPRFITWDGTNGAEVATFIGPDQEVKSDNGVTLEVGAVGSSEIYYTVSVGHSFNYAVGTMSPTVLAGEYSPEASMLNSGVVAGTSNGASVTVPLLLLGAAVDRVVAWDVPFPDASYKVRFMPDANTLGRVTPTVKAGTKTANGLTVTITAGLAVTVAGVLHVIAST